MPGFTASRRVRSMGAYAFAEVDAQVARLRERGIEPVDFGVGDPSVPTPERVRRACQQAVDRHATSGYPSYVGSLEFREAVAAWTLRRHGVRLDPRTEVASTIGSKEAIFHFHEAVLDPGDVVLAPSPGYPPYLRGTLFAEGASWCYPLTREGGFLPDLDAIPTPVLLRARLLWINYPNSPTGRVAPPDFLRRVVEFGRRHGLVVASDEAYSELGFTPDAPHS
ncbi:MAG: aminotransferase class I/II-fold pyridoxal phosphate-dependent enzyme, partial [Planctomycetes bacterium]|nr:aminotransferase class I/II-fold pyridoxal phosphate-dependent enzyme [Planctomycetota bacterium]